jgi:DNA-binding transcriptional MerR regulator
MDTMTSAAEPRHPIAVVADRTGLTQDVLRVWERRYGVVTPARGAGGQRLYSDDDIARLRLLRNATEAGRPISQVADLDETQLETIAAEDIAARALRSRDEAVSTPLAGAVDEAMDHTISMDADALEIALRRASSAYGIPSFLNILVAPFLQRLGDEWNAGRIAPAQEHLATAILQGVMLDLTRSLTTTDNAPRLLTATPPGERHAIGALMAGMVAALEGWRAVFLGADLPAIEIANAASATGARAVGVSIIHVTDRPGIAREMTALRANLPEHVRLFIGGAGAAAIERDIGRGVPATIVCRDLDTLRAALRDAIDRTEQ